MKQPMDSDLWISEQKKRLAANPDCSTASYNLGVSLLEQGKLAEAVEAFN